MLATDVDIEFELIVQEETWEEPGCEHSQHYHPVHGPAMHDDGNGYWNVVVLSPCCGAKELNLIFCDKFVQNMCLNEYASVRCNECGYRWRCAPDCFVVLGKVGSNK